MSDFVDELNDLAQSDDETDVNDDVNSPVEKNKEEKMLTFECSGAGGLLIYLQNLKSTEATIRDIVYGVFEKGLGEYLGEGPGSHIWTVNLNNKYYKGGVILDTLNLKIKDRLIFEYDMGNTTTMEFKVHSIVDTNNLNSDVIQNILSFADPPATGSRLFTDQERQESDDFRTRKAAANETMWSRRFMEVIPYQEPKWSNQEEHAIILLQYAGLTFAKAWKPYIEPSLVNRSKSASAG